MVSVAHQPDPRHGSRAVSVRSAMVQRLSKHHSTEPPDSPSAVTPGQRARRAAAWAAQHGFKVFPLATDAKRPAVRDWEHRATDQPDYIRERWPQRATGYGIACGPSGLYVIDCDTPKDDTPPAPPDVADAACGLDTLCLLAAAVGEPMPANTMTVRTGRGGYHLIYRMPRGVELHNTAGTLGWLIDTRGAGGYIVGPGSTVEGRTYEVIDWSAPAEVPAWIVQRLTEQRAKTASHGGAGEPLPASPVRLAGASVGPQWIDAALTQECERVRSAPNGEGNHAVNAAGYAVGRLVGGQLISRDVAEASLMAALDSWVWSAPGDRARMLRTLRSALADGEANPRVPAPREQRRRSAQ